MANSGVVASVIAYVFYELKVEVWRPVTVFVGYAEGANFLSAVYDLPLHKSGKRHFAKVTVE